MSETPERPQLPPGLVFVRMSKKHSLVLTGAEFDRGKKRWESWNRILAETKAKQAAQAASPGTVSVREHD